MPTYSYKCTNCGHAFDTVQSFTDDALTTCEVCGGTLRKVFSPVGVTFNGSGFYRTDSRSGGKAAGGSSGDSSSSSGDSSSSSSSSSDKGGSTSSGAGSSGSSGSGSSGSGSSGSGSSSSGSGAA